MEYIPEADRACIQTAEIRVPVLILGVGAIISHGRERLRAVVLGRGGVERRRPHRVADRRYSRISDKEFDNLVPHTFFNARPAVGCCYIGAVDRARRALAIRCSSARGNAVIWYGARYVAVAYSELSRINGFIFIVELHERPFILDNVSRGFEIRSAERRVLHIIPRYQIGGLDRIEISGGRYDIPFGELLPGLPEKLLGVVVKLALFVEYRETFNHIRVVEVCRPAGGLLITSLLPAFSGTSTNP